MGLTFRDCEPADPRVGGSWGGSSRTVSLDSLDWEGSIGALLERLGEPIRLSLIPWSTVARHSPGRRASHKGELRNAGPGGTWASHQGPSSPDYLPLHSAVLSRPFPTPLLYNDVAWCVALPWPALGYEPNRAGGDSGTLQKDTHTPHAGAGASA